MHRSAGYTQQSERLRRGGTSLRRRRPRRAEARPGVRRSNNPGRQTPEEHLTIHLLANGTKGNEQRPGYRQQITGAGMFENAMDKYKGGSEITYTINPEDQVEGINSHGGNKCAINVTNSRIHLENSERRWNKDVDRTRNITRTAGVCKRPVSITINLLAQTETKGTTWGPQRRLRQQMNWSWNLHGVWRSMRTGQKIAYSDHRGSASQDTPARWTATTWRTSIRRRLQKLKRKQDMGR